MKLKVIKITKADLDARNFYKGSSSLDVDGSIQIEGGLGCVRFRGFLKAAASIAAAAGSGIKAGSGIEAGFQISAKKTISAKLRVFAGLCIWRLPNRSETTITAQRVEGTVCFGDVKLLAADTAEAPATAATTATETES